MPQSNRRMSISAVSWCKDSKSCPIAQLFAAFSIDNHQIVDYDLVLDQKFGKEGTPERIKAEEDALSFYSGQILLDARKEAKVTQTEMPLE